MKLDLITILSFVMVALLIGAVYYRKKKLKFHMPGFNWREHWKSHSEDYKLIGYIAGLLFFANILFSQFRWRWWQVNYDKSLLFWMCQIALLFSFYTILEAKNKWVKGLAILLIVAMSIGWIDNANDKSRMLVVGASQLSGQPEEFNVKKGEWSPKLSPKAYQAAPVAGLKLRMDGEDEKTVDWKAGTKHFYVPADVTYVQIRSTEEEVKVIGTRLE